RHRSISVDSPLRGSTRAVACCRVVGSKVLTLTPARFTIAREHRMLALETEHRPERRADKRVGEHLNTMSKDESRTVNERGREMPQLDPAFGPPPEEFNLERRQMLAAHDRRRAVVMGNLIVDDQPAIAKLPRHRCSRVRRRMLNVRPIDVATGEC